MSETNDRIVVKCSCGVRIRVPAGAVGKKGKCPKCGATFVVKPEAAPIPVAEPPTPPDSGGSLMDDLAQQEQNAETLGPPLTGGAAMPCTQCGTIMPPGAVLCTTCGYNTQTGRSAKTSTKTGGGAGAAAAGLAKSAGTFVLGTILSGIGAAIGGVVWYLIAHFTGYEVGYIAVGVGVLTGLGMRLGYQCETFVAGVVASGWAILGIVGAKFVVFFMLIAAAVTGFTDDVELQRVFVTMRIADQILTERGLEDEAEREAQWDSARAEAERRVQGMSDDEVRQQWEEFQQEAQEELDSRPRDAEVPPPLEEEPMDVPAVDEQEDGPGLLTLFFQAMFSPFDALWLILAVGASFKIAGTTADE